MQNLYIVAGCNGSGKTTASYGILPILNCKEFVNADEIARGLSPFSPDNVALQAGKLMLKRIKELMAQKKDFAFETTLATRSYRNLILEAKKNNYKVTLIFFWLESIKLAKDRVKQRVQEGGHNIPEETISRRYKRGIKNLFEIYLPICDEVEVYDNTEEDTENIKDTNKDKGRKIVMQKTKNNNIIVRNKEIYQRIKNYECNFG